MISIAARHGDDDLGALGLLCHGETLVANGDLHSGLQLLDEAMLAVDGGDLSPLMTGLLYCAVLDTCIAACDLRRAAEWTDSLSDWCERQSDAVPFRGPCRVPRSQVLQARGVGAAAAAAAEDARRRLSDPTVPALGLAQYQVGELHRLRGSYHDAEDAFQATFLVLARNAGSISRTSRTSAPGLNDDSDGQPLRRAPGCAARTHVPAPRRRHRAGSFR
jgi:hypothetical protein